ncbi:MAG: helix-turn-helix domain-containing protein [Magnetococcales bacterium]|nr:helix-turn-helix domain-containing protein [Magnetococcales bacterium]
MEVAETGCPDPFEVACEHCKLYGFLRLLEQMGLDSSPYFLSRHREIAKGDRLFETGQTFHGIYAVKKGSFKSHTMADDPEGQISGFYLPGELLGLDAIRIGVYGYQATALEAGLVCLLPFNRLEQLGASVSLFQEQLIQVLVEQVRHDQHQALLVGRRSAEERLGMFLLNLGERYERHGFGSGEFRLPMLQNDIANYLGLSIETVSRTLRSFREQGLVRVQGRRVSLLDSPRLRSLTRT